jgi:hypothetical protein
LESLLSDTKIAILMQCVKSTTDILSPLISFITETAHKFAVAAGAVV